MGADVLTDSANSTSRLHFGVVGWSAFCPALEGRLPEALAHNGGEGWAIAPAPAEKLPSILRRRVSPIGQMAFRVSQALSERHVGRFVFCSRHGEFERLVRILSSLANGEEISPADFSLSVHNALAGLLSMAWHNTAGHTAISAGPDSFAYGLLEAVTSLSDGRSDPAMLVYFDNVLPSPYDEIVEETETTVALAMLLSAPNRDGCHNFALEVQPKGHTFPSAGASSQCLDFINFMLSDETERTFSGARVQWRWRRCA